MNTNSKRAQEGEVGWLGWTESGKESANTKMRKYKYKDKYEYSEWGIRKEARLGRSESAMESANTKMCKYKYKDEYEYK